MDEQQTPLLDQLPIAGAAGTTGVAGSEILPREGQGFSIGEAARAATGHWLHNLIIDHPDMEDEPDFHWSEELVSEMTKDIRSPEGQKYILDPQVGSRAEAMARRERVLASQKEMEKLIDSGFAAKTAYVLTSMFDPTEIAAITAATAGLGTVPQALSKAYKGTKVVDEIAEAARLRNSYSVSRRAAEGFVVGGATSGIFEGIRQSYEPEGNLDDLPLYIAFGGALGGTVEGAATAWGKLKRLSVYNKRMATGIPLLPEERILFADIIEDQSLATAQTRLAQMEDVEKQLVDVANPRTESETVPLPMGEGKDFAYYNKMLWSENSKVEKDLDNPNLYLTNTGNRDLLFNAYGFPDGAAKFKDKPKEWAKVEAVLKYTRTEDEVRRVLEAAVGNKKLPTVDDLGGGGKTGLPDGAFDSSKPRDYDNAPEQRGIPLLGLRKRLSAIANAMSSKSGMIRDLAPRLGANSAGNKDGSAVRFSAPEWQAWLGSSSTSRFFTPLINSRKKWVSETYGRVLSPGRQGELARQFNEMVAKAVRRNDTTDPRTAAAVKQWQQEMAYFAKTGKEAKIRGYESLETDATYVPRIFDEAKTAGIIERVGRDNVVRLVRESILRKQPDIDARILDDIADGYVTGLQERIRGVGAETMRVRQGVREDTLDDIYKGLMAKYKDEAKVEEIMQAFESKIKQSSSGMGIPRARRRVNLDETVAIKLKDGSELSFEDLLINDIEDLHQMYAFQMGGAIGLAKNGIEQEGMKSFQEILNDIRMDSQNVKGLTRADLDSQINSLQFMFDGITGQLAHQSGISESAERVLRRLREFNFIVHMGSSGLASMVEIANVLLDHHMRTTIRGLPRLRQMVAKMQNGELSDPLVRELQQFTGVGIDIMTGRMRKGYGVDESEFLKADYTRADHLLAYGRNKVAMISGMLPLTAMMRRADSMFYAMDWANAALKTAKSGKLSAPYSRIKLEQLGIDQATGSRIIQMINKHAEFKGKDLITLHMDKWDDAAARDAFSQSAYRHVMQSVQDTSQSSLNRFLQSPIGKTVGQFLNYVLGSQEQQFQRFQARMVDGDAKAVSAILATQALIGTLVYLSRTSLSVAGRSEEEQRRILEKKLQWDRIAIDGSLGYMGAASFFMTFVQRANGNNIISNPTIDAVERFTSMSKTLLFNAVEGDREVSEAKMNQWLRGLPLSSTYPGIIGTNILADALTD